MMRQSTAAGAIEGSWMFTTNGGTKVHFHWRTMTNGSSSSSSSSVTGLPYWVRLIRSGNTISPYRSSDGTNWTQVGTNTTLTMSNPIRVGLLVTSGDTTAIKTATFDNVSLTQP